MSPPVQFRRQGLNTASAQKDSKQTGEQEEAPVAAASNYHTTRASPHHHIGAPRPTPPPTHVHGRQTEFQPDVRSFPLEKTAVQMTTSGNGGQDSKPW